MIVPATTDTAQRIHARLMTRLSPTVLEVIDESALHAGHAGSDGRSEGTHVRVRIASPQFAGLVRLAKHRLVYDALQDFIDAGLHALAIDLVPTDLSTASSKVLQ